MTLMMIIITMIMMIIMIRPEIKHIRKISLTNTVLTIIKTLFIK